MPVYIYVLNVVKLLEVSKGEMKREYVEMFG